MMWLFSSKASEWTARGKNVVITGASAGIGAELARQFARHGASLALLARSEEKLREVARQCREESSVSADDKVEAHVIPCDLTDQVQIQKAVETATSSFAEKRIDVLILNAGRSQGCYFEEIKSVEDINYMLQLNVNGVINTAHYALPFVPKSADSRIVIVASVAGLIGVPYRSIYCASKHAVVGFANSLRMELVDTYDVQGAPTVQIINFPEVKGTELNSNRMEMGASQSPAQFMVTANMPSVEQACSDMYSQIELGTREWGQPTIVSILRLIKGLAPAFFDGVLTKMVKGSHYRPQKDEK